MSSTMHFGNGARQTALVIVFPSGVKGLFNPEVHRLVSEVQDQLENVYVTYALSGGPSPGIDAAMSAARFAGCASAVVIHSEDWTAGASAIDSTSDTTLTGEGHGELELRETVHRVVDAFNNVKEASGMAA